MKYNLLIVVLAINCNVISFSQNNNRMKQPIADKKTKELISHGHQRSDDYFWMNERDSEPVLSHLEKENAYTANYFTSLQGLTSTILDEFEKRIDPNETSSPFTMNGRMYQVRNVEGKDYAQVYVLEGMKESLFFDECKFVLGW